MRHFRNIINLATIVFLMIVSISSCAPAKYSLEMERKVNPEYKVDFDKRFPGIVTCNSGIVSDSVLLSQVALGMAEKIEENLNIDGGSIPVYAVSADSINLKDSEVRAYLHKAVGTDILIFLHNFSTEDFKVKYKQEKAYYNNQFLNQIVVKLFYNLNVSIYEDNMETKLADFRLNDMMDWLLYSENKIDDVMAISKVSNRINTSFKDLGGVAVDKFMPHWDKDVQSLYVFQDERWATAFEYAYKFQWEKAMEIWMREAEKNNARKAACAAYNISIACKVLGMDDLSKQWMERYINFKY